MATRRYRVTVNGFRVGAETWDDALQWDGKRDEVFVSAVVSAMDQNGNELYKNETTSPVMGDTYNQPGRIRKRLGRTTY